MYLAPRFAYYQVAKHTYGDRIFLDKNTYHTTHVLSPTVKQRYLRYSFETPTFYQNYLAMSNTADVTVGKPLAV
jgi:hypothetical protein